MCSHVRIAGCHDFSCVCCWEVNTTSLPKIDNYDCIDYNLVCCFHLQKVWIHSCWLTLCLLLLCKMEFRSLIEQYELTEQDCTRQIEDVDLDRISDSHCMHWRKLPTHLGMDKLLSHHFLVTSYKKPFFWIRLGLSRIVTLYFHSKMNRH